MTAEPHTESDPPTTPTDKRIEAAYLTGWEFNRLLGQHPAEARNSALPSDILWEGGAALWLFKKIWVTQESLDNERAAGEILGWTTGQVFADLASDGCDHVIRPISWSALPRFVRNDLEERAAGLREGAYSPDAIREAIRSKAIGTLEEAKAELIEPVIRHLGAVPLSTPGTLRQWAARPGAYHPYPAGNPLDAALATVARPVGLNGVTVCLRPSQVDVSRTAKEGLRRARKAEATMIPELFAGDGAFSGPTGYLPYLEALRDHSRAYSPVDKVLVQDWKRRRRDNLLRLRAAADRYLWKDLHGDWLPRVVSGDRKFALEEFPRLVDRALAEAPFAGLLDRASTWVWALGGALGALTAQTANMVFDLHGAAAEVLPTTATFVVSLAVGSAYKHEGKANNLALFYQEALRHEAR